MTIGALSVGAKFTLPHYADPLSGIDAETVFVVKNHVPGQRAGLTLASSFNPRMRVAMEHTFNSALEAVAVQDPATSPSP